MSLTVSVACNKVWRCWWRSWRMLTPSSSVWSKTFLLSLIRSPDWFNLSVDISNLSLWSTESYMWFQDPSINPFSNNCIRNRWKHIDIEDKHTMAWFARPDSINSSLELIYSTDEAALFTSFFKLFKSDLYSLSFARRADFWLGCKLRASKSILQICKFAHTLFSAYLMIDQIKTWWLY